MISNRQGGRRRGRGGQRQNLGGPPGGNRQDNRQRGNAAQLLEKYKNMARDAQLSGDRVQMEYFLQYADHYFRVLNESRARFEEQRKQRGEDGDESDEDEAAEAAGEQDGDEERQQRPQRKQRSDRGERSRRSARDDDDGSDRDQGSRRSRSNGNGGDERIALEALPPSIGRDDDQQADSLEEARPRRRTRRPRAQDGEGEIAPAA